MLLAGTIAANDDVMMVVEPAVVGDLLWLYRRRRLVRLFNRNVGVGCCIIIISSFLPSTFIF